MNLPFGLQSRKEAARKREEDEKEKEKVKEAALLEQRLEEYRNTLVKYQKCLQDYSTKMDGYEKDYEQDQLTLTQTAKDMTYLKEQNGKTTFLLNELYRQFDNLSNQLAEMETTHEEKTIASLVSLSSSMAVMNSKLDALDKNAVNRLSELLLELQKQTLYQNKQQQTELLGVMERLTKSEKKNHALQWILLILNIFGLGILAFLVLYVLGIIPISF
jgi:hypothetical protein